MSDIYHMRSKFVWGIILLTVFLLAYGYLTTEKTHVITDESAQTEEQIQQSFMQAISSTDISECAGINDETRKRNCEIIILSQKALSEDDATTCSLIPEIEHQCISEFNKKKAAQTGDETYCQSGTNKDQCYFNLAISSADAAFCDKIESQTMRNNCFSVVGG